MEFEIDEEDVITLVLKLDMTRFEAIEVLSTGIEMDYLLF